MALLDTVRSFLAKIETALGTDATPAAADGVAVLSCKYTAPGTSSL